MDEATRLRADAFQARRLGCEPEALRRRGVTVVETPLPGPPSLHVVARGDALVVAGAGPLAQAVAALAGDPPRLPEPGAVRARLGARASRVVGPVFLGYQATAPALPAGAGVARLVTPADTAAIQRLRDAVTPEEWEHAGFAARPPLAGVFAEGRLLAAAGFTVLEECVAHLGVLSHPACRGRGSGRRAVAVAAGLAAGRSLLLQYQTLESNAPSLRIAASLGFEAFGRSLAVRLAGGAS